jgi:hypothetical protein
MSVGAMGFVFIAICRAIRVSELRYDFKMLRIDTIFISANMMQELIGCQFDTISEFVRNAMSAFCFPIDNNGTITSRDFAANPNPTLVYEDITQRKPLYISVIHDLRSFLMLALQ